MFAHELLILQDGRGKQARYAEAKTRRAQAIFYRTG